MNSRSEHAFLGLNGDAPSKTCSSRALRPIASLFKDPLTKLFEQRHNIWNKIHHYYFLNILIGYFIWQREREIEKKALQQPINWNHVQICFGPLIILLQGNRLLLPQIKIIKSRSICFFYILFSQIHLVNLILRLGWWTFNFELAISDIDVLPLYIISVHILPENWPKLVLPVCCLV